MEWDLSPWKLLTATAALLAFLVGLYTLIGRERKSPHQINDVFSIFFLLLAGAVLDLLAAVLHPCWSRWLLRAGAFFLVTATILTTWRLYRLYFRFALFVDSGNPKHLFISRIVKDHWRSLKQNKSYEHHAVPIPQDLKVSIGAILSEDDTAGRTSNDLEFKSAAIHVETQAHATSILAKMAIEFLNSGYCVQYMTASRHPVEFVEALRARVAHQANLQWNQFCRNIVVVDAYTKHFGFTDSIYFAATRRLRSELNVSQVTAARSYAGLHSASSVAFNRIKEMAGGADTRKPVLVIYEDCYALSDLESVEQYRVFVRHVLPSERLWDGMFTVFVETDLPKNDWGLLRSYASFSKELLPIERRESGG